MLKSEMEKIRSIIENRVNEMINSKDLHDLIRQIATEEIKKGEKKKPSTPAKYPAKAETRTTIKKKEK